jgi:TRAP-type C4-dicarboxylate transport system permease small subunit
LPFIHSVLGWLRARAENVAAGLLAAMFLTFILQIFTRYVINHPLSWTVEACLTLWLWLVFWTAAFVLEDRDHVRFDLVQMAVSRRIQRILALVSAVAITAGIAAALPATLDYITFYKIKSSSTLRIRLDVVFSVYGIFAVSIIVAYTLRAVAILRGADGAVDGPDSR